MHALLRENAAENQYKGIIILQLINAEYVVTLKDEKIPVKLDERCAVLALLTNRRALHFALLVDRADQRVRHKIMPLPHGLGFLRLRRSLLLLLLPRPTRRRHAATLASAAAAATLPPSAAARCAVRARNVITARSAARIAVPTTAVLLLLLLLLMALMLLMRPSHWWWRTSRVVARWSITAAVAARAIVVVAVLVARTDGAAVGVDAWLIVALPPSLLRYLHSHRGAGEIAWIES